MRTTANNSLVLKRAACMDDCGCLAFQWSESYRHCGLKDTGDLYMSVRFARPGLCHHFDRPYVKKEKENVKIKVGMCINSEYF